MKFFLLIAIAFAVADNVWAQSVDPTEDEARIEELIRLRAEKMRAATQTAQAAVETILPPPVATLPEASAGIPPGPVSFEQLANLKGRWIIVRLKSGSVRRGELVAVDGSSASVRVGNGAQSATLPLNKKNIRSLELLR